MKVIQKEFPNTPIFINSSSTSDFGKIFSLIKNINSKFILGVNYYYKVPGQYRIPILNKLDNLILRKLFSVSPENLKSKATENKYTVEVSELQGEPWDPVTTPGNSFKEFIFTLYRAKYLRPNTQDKIIVRYWGIEYLVCKLINNPENIERNLIKDLIISINGE